jgi:Leucine-rich repeat (LRR) protein
MYRLDRHLLFQIAKKLSLTDLLNFCSCNKEINRKLECSIWDYLINTLSEINDKSDQLLQDKKEYCILLYNLNQIKNILKIPENLNVIYTIEDLNIINVVNIFPRELCRLRNLKTLNLSGNQIQKIPREIYLLENLVTLNLSMNMIQKIPEEINQLKNLRNLYLSNNLIKEIPSTFPPNLQYLHLAYNDISTIPETIWNLYSLLVLRLENNKIKQLKLPNIALTNLNKLDIHNNQIEELIILYLSELEELNIKGNPINKIEIGVLPKLKFLSLDNKQIRKMDAKSVSYYKIVMQNYY